MPTRTARLPLDEAAQPGSDSEGRQTRFRRATCRGSPVATELAAALSFRLGQNCAADCKQVVLSHRRFEPTLWPVRCSATRAASQWRRPFLLRPTGHAAVARRRLQQPLSVRKIEQLKVGPCVHAIFRLFSYSKPFKGVKLGSFIAREVALRSRGSHKQRAKACMCHVCRLRWSRDRR